jgi:hypothetical protein
MTVNPEPPPPPVVVKQAVTPWKFLLGSLAIALVAGFAGGLVSHAAFPTPAGPRGATGAPGKQGPPGAAGAAGTASSVTLAKIGFCFTVSSESGASVYYVNGVTIAPPTDTNGVLSCRTGRYVTLQPELPTGSKAATYTP